MRDYENSQIKTHISLITFDIKFKSSILFEYILFIQYRIEFIKMHKKTVKDFER